MSDNHSLLTDEPTAVSWISQGLALNYWDWGNRDKPVLLLLHGNGDHGRSWDTTAQALRRDWHVIAPDWRGHGDSQWSPDGAYFTPYYVMELADLVEHLDASRVSIVAHSFGGVVAMRYAALFPERVNKLVVVDGHGPSDSARQQWNHRGGTERTREWVEKRRKLAGKPPSTVTSIAEGAKRLQKNAPRISAAQAEHLARHGLKQTDNGYHWKRDPMVTAFTPEDFAQEGGELWQHIQAQTLFLYARESWKFEPEVRELENHFQNASGYVFDAAGHWLHHDQPQAFVRVVREFLQ